MRLKLKNIFHQVTYKMLLKNRTRTMITIIGIILSTALITAIAAFVSSLRNSMLEFKISESGNWHGAVLAMDTDTAQQLCEDNAVKPCGSLYNLGYAAYHSQRVQAAAADKAFFETMPLEVTEGRLPQNEQEILLPVAFLQMQDTRAALGDTIELELGVLTDKNGQPQSQANYSPYSEDTSDIKLQIRAERTQTYTVVGFYKNTNCFTNGSMQGLPLLTSRQNQSAYDVSVYFRYKNTGKLYDFLQNYRAYSTMTNEGVLRLMGTSRYSSYYSFIYSIAMIVIVLVMAGSVLVIFNSFAISVSERMKQFGLLSSIGATRSQLRASILFEAAFVSVIGIPVGVAAGIAGIGLTMWGIRGKLQSVAASMVSLGEMHLSVSWAAVLAAVAAAVVTVLVSAFIPMIKISRMSAIEVIRQKEDIKLSRRKVRTSRLFYRLFGLEGMLARKNFKRSRKKYRTTIISLFVSIVLFISAVSFSHYLVESIQGIYKVGSYEITYSQYSRASTYSSKLVEQMKQAPAVREAGTARIVYAEGHFQTVDLSAAYLENQSASGRVNMDVPDAENPAASDSYSIQVRLYGIEDAVYRDYLKEHRLSEQTFMDSTQPQMIAMAKLRTMNEKTGKVTESDVFHKDQLNVRLSFTDSGKEAALREEYKDQLDLKSEHTQAEYKAYQQLEAWIAEESSYKAEVQIGLFTEELPYTVGTSARYNGILLLCPVSYFNRIVDSDKTSWSETTYFKTTGHQQAYEELSKILIENGHDSDVTWALKNEAMEYESRQSMVFVVRVFAAGFIVLMSLIAVANVFNTISTNMMLRRREFAMLKSTGMTDKGFNRMMYYECVMYGSKALLLGIPVALLFTWWIYRSVSDLWSTGYQIPWLAILIAAVSVFAVVIATMMYVKHKINRMNMLDIIKDENI